MLTTGSVGHDETIDLVMSIPLEDRWLGNRPELAAFRGLSLAIPIRGTLSKPKIDSSALKDLSKQLVRQAAGQLIDQQLRRGLESLLELARGGSGSSPRHDFVQDYHCS